MTSKGLSFCIVIALAAGGTSWSFPQAQEDENVRGSFLTSRPKTAEKSTTSAPAATPSRRRPKTTNKGTTAKTGATGTSAKGVPTTDAGATAKASSAPRIGLGLSLFMRDSNSLAVRVDPAHEFRGGDRVRVLLETNADGHVYIFNTTDGGDPVMIYPDPALDEAGNFIKAHVPMEIPSSVAAEERLRWFRFDESAGTERLYFVFAREPLAGVPIEDELISHCSQNKARCQWRPSSELWARLQKGLGTPLQVAKSPTYGRAQTSGEHNATTRGIGLAQDDPEPSLVLMTSSANAAMLVAKLDLVHK